MVRMLFNLRVECAVSNVNMDSTTDSNNKPVNEPALSVSHPVLREGQHRSAV